MRKTEGWHYISRIYELELNSEVQNSVWVKKIYNFLCDLKGVNREIQDRLIANFTKADKDFGECIKKGLKIKD